VVLHDLRPSIVSGTNGLQWRLVVADDGNWICNKVSCVLSQLLAIAESLDEQGIDTKIILMARASVM
jgi:hypothetical protein